MKLYANYSLLLVTFTHLTVVSVQAVRPDFMGENDSESSRSVVKRDALTRIASLVKEKAALVKGFSVPGPSLRDLPKSEGLDREAYIEQIMAYAARREEEEQRRQADLDRYGEIDREVAEIAFEYYQEENRATDLTDKCVSYSTDPMASAFEGDSLNTKRVVRTSVPNKAQKDFYATSLPDQPGLWFGMERVTSHNVEYWRQRLGWEATINFGKNFERTVGDDLFVLGTEPSQDLENYIEGSLLKPTLFWPNYGRPYTIARRENLMALRNSPLSGAPENFQKVYEATKKDDLLDSDPNPNLTASFDGFRMNLETYGMIPTWVAYICAGQDDQPVSQSRALTSSDIKITTTFAVEGPFYSPLGIFSSPIAKAFNGSVPRLSIPLHVAIARTMKAIDPEIRAMITRPLEEMTAIFKKSGIPYQAGFGENPENPSKPYIRREWSTSKAYTFVDTTTGNKYVLSQAHPFSMHPSLGGIVRQDMEYPFVVFDINSLADYRN